MNNNKNIGGNNKINIDQINMEDNSNNNIIIYLTIKAIWIFVI